MIPQKLALASMFSWFVSVNMHSTNMIVAAFACRREPPAAVAPGIAIQEVYAALSRFLAVFDFSMTNSSIA